MELGRHAPALDGIRGVAVLLVVLGHMGNWGMFLVPGLAHDVLGHQGVWLFFALSAFLLTGRLTEELEAGRDVRGSFAAYAVHRVFRIYPLYLLVILVHWWIGDFTARIAALHVMLLKGWEELWAIPVEFSYYFVIPLVAWLAVRVGHRRTAL